MEISREDGRFDTTLDLRITYRRVFIGQVGDYRVLKMDATSHNNNNNVIIIIIFNIIIILH
jgi:hypothetical protein